MEDVNYIMGKYLERGHLNNYNECMQINRKRIYK